jgi:hypothetical protein
LLKEKKEKGHEQQSLWDNKLKSAKWPSFGEVGGRADKAGKPQLIAYKLVLHWQC